MPRKKALIFLMISLVVSALTLWAAVRWVNRQVTSRSSHQSVRIVVAAVPVSAGEALNASMLKFVEWPAQEPIVGGFSDPSQLNNRVTLDSMAIGEPVLDSHLAPQGSKAGLTALITSGKRGMAVHVSDVSGVAGFALPGSQVDVLVSFQDEQNHMISRIILQDIKVLAVAQDMAVKDDIKAKVVNVVTLEVSPEQAESLELAKALGSISLVLRNQADKREVVTTGARKPALLVGAASESKPVVASVKTAYRPPVIHAPPATVEIIRGTVRASMTPQ